MDIWKKIPMKYDYHFKWGLLLLSIITMVSLIIMDDLVQYISERPNFFAVTLILCCIFSFSFGGVLSNYFLKKEYLIGVKDLGRVIGKREATANDVWIFSPELYYDVHSPEFKKIIRRNLQKGVVYRYIVPDNEKIRDRINSYKMIYELSDEQMSKMFLILHPIDFSEFLNEIVIYNAKDPSLFSYLYCRSYGKPEDDVLIFDARASLNNSSDFSALWVKHKGVHP